MTASFPRKSPPQAWWLLSSLVATRGVTSSHNSMRTTTPCANSFEFKNHQESTIILPTSSSSSSSFNLLLLRCPTCYSEEILGSQDSNSSKGIAPSGTAWPWLPNLNTHLVMVEPSALRSRSGSKT
jgi:hypothetical protein